MDDKALYFDHPLAFRDWLEQNHGQEEELWVGYFKKSTGIPSMTWPQSVDQALCFGWIDGLRKTVDEQRYRIRFTPRRKNSHWSRVNINRIQELHQDGLVRPEVYERFLSRDPKRDQQYSYEQGLEALAQPFIETLQQHATALDFFEQLAPSYKRSTVHWVMSAKREETREKRFKILLESCLQGLKIPMLRK